MNRTILDLWVGIFLLAGFAALLFLSLKVADVGGERREKGYVVEARFDNIGGLKAQAPVKASGVLVGRVKSIIFDNKKFNAQAELEIFDRYQFPKDTAAAIQTSGLLGEVYIGLEAGNDSQMLKAGDKLALTQSAVVIEKLISQFMFQKAQEGEPKK